MSATLRTANESITRVTPLMIMLIVRCLREHEIKLEESMRPNNYSRATPVIILALHPRGPFAWVQRIPAPLILSTAEVTARFQQALLRKRNNLTNTDEAQE